MGLTEVVLVVIVMIVGGFHVPALIRQRGSGAGVSAGLWAGGWLLGVLSLLLLPIPVGGSVAATLLAVGGVSGTVTRVTQRRERLRELDATLPPPDEKPAAHRLELHNRLDELDGVERWSPILPILLMTVTGFGLLMVLYGLAQTEVAAFALGAYLVGYPVHMAQTRLADWREMSGVEKRLRRLEEER